MKNTNKLLAFVEYNKAKSTEFSPVICIKGTYDMYGPLEGEVSTVKETWEVPLKIFEDTPENGIVLFQNSTKNSILILFKNQICYVTKEFYEMLDSEKRFNVKSKYSKCLECNNTLSSIVTFKNFEELHLGFNTKFNLTISDIKLFKKYMKDRWLFFKYINTEDSNREVDLEVLLNNYHFYGLYDKDVNKHIVKLIWKMKCQEML